MNDRTLSIIAVCKGNTKYESKLSLDLIDSVKNYLSDFSGCDKKILTPKLVEEVILAAFYDFIDVCDKPSYFLRQLDNLKNVNFDLSTRICMLFRATQVVEEGHYINGFNERFDKIQNELLLYPNIFKE